MKLGASFTWLVLASCVCCLTTVTYNNSTTLALLQPIHSNMCNKIYYTQASGSDQELGYSENYLQDSELQTSVEATAVGMCVV